MCFFESLYTLNCAVQLLLCWLHCFGAGLSVQLFLISVRMSDNDGFLDIGGCASGCLRDEAVTLYCHHHHASWAEIVSRLKLVNSCFYFALEISTWNVV